MSLLSSFKGAVGEAMGNLAAKAFLDASVYKAVNNVTLETANGTTQIDHVLVSRFGVFVVEAKNYQGWIFGGVEQAQWTQSLPGGAKFRFQNPLRQNYRHIKALADFLNLPEDRFHSVVMFWGEAEFKTEMPPNVLTTGYTSFIKSKTEPLFTDAEVDLIVEAVKTGMLPNGWLSGRATKKQHLESLKARHESTTQCPKCGAPLTERTVKSGARAGESFLGCSAFPKCRFTKPTES